MSKVQEAKQTRQKQNKTKLNEIINVNVNVVPRSTENTNGETEN